MTVAQVVVIAGATAGLMSCSAVRPAVAPDRSVGDLPAVDELLRTIRVEQQMRAATDALADLMIRANPALEPYRDVLVDWAHETMTWEALVPELREIYSSAFTETEMREMIRFYRSPTGQKVLDQSPGLMQRSLAAGSKLGELHRDELRERIVERAKQLNHDLPREAP